MAPMAHAQLLLSGKVTGQFTGAPGPHDTIYNAPDGSSAWIKSGIPEHPWDKQTAIQFGQKNFTNIGPGLVASDLFKVTNGRTLLHSTATAAHFDLSLTLTSPVSHSSLLSSIAFTIENTPNGPDPHSVDDNYTITASPIAPFKIDNTWVQFKFVAPASFSIHENQSMYVGDLYVSFVPVPEPATYGMIGAALLTGLIGFRALRRRSTSATA
jgi:hypothetical protein